jgi:hypothetical protein
MSTSNFERYVSNLLSKNNTISSYSPGNMITKMASATKESDITVESLRKIATILRSTKAEPSYKDLAKFVDRIV